MLTAAMALVVIGLIIAAHELGHFIFAKRFGVLVYSFSVGFGPNLLRKRFGETEFSLRLLPLGGFVRFAQRFSPHTEAPPIPTGRAFEDKPVWQRIVVMVGGPAANIALAFVVLVSAFSLRGYEEPKILKVLPNTPAAIAGLEEGDTILSVNNKAINHQNAQELRRFTVADQVELEVLRGSKRLVFTMIPETLPDGKLGIGISYDPGSKLPPKDALSYSAKMTYRVSILSLRGVFSTVQRIWEREDTAVRLVGPIGISQEIGEAAQAGLTDLALLSAYISILVGVMNLLPVPVLDGGNIFFLLIEGVRRKPLSQKVEIAVRSVGGLILLGVIAFALLQDTIRIVSG